MGVKPRGQLSSRDLEDMKNDFWDISKGDMFDINRKIRSSDNSLGGSTFTTTNIATTHIDLQNFTVESILRDEQKLGVGGLRTEADYKGFVEWGIDVREQDIITPDSGTTRFEVKFKHQYWNEHIEIFVKKVD